MAALICHCFFADIMTQVGLASGGVRPVTMKTFIRQNRPNVAVVLHGRIGRVDFALAATQQTTQHQDECCIRPSGRPDAAPRVANDAGMRATTDRCGSVTFHEVTPIGITRRSRTLTLE